MIRKQINIRGGPLGKIGRVHFELAQAHCEGPKYQSGVSGPEAILSLLVTLILTELDRLPIPHLPDMHLWERCGNPASLYIRGGQHNYEIALGQDVVHVNAKRAPGKLHSALKEASDLIVPGIVA